MIAQTEIARMSQAGSRALSTLRPLRAGHAIGIAAWQSFEEGMPTGNKIVAPRLAIVAGGGKCAHFRILIVDYAATNGPLRSMLEQLADTGVTWERQRK